MCYYMIPLKRRVEAELHVLALLAHRGLRIRRHALLEEVVLVFERDALHEIERVRGAVNLRVAELETEAIRNKLNILLHELGVHTDELTGQRLRDEMLLDFHGLANDLVRLLLREFVEDFPIKETGEIGVNPFIARNEFIGEGEAGHDTTLLEPEDGTEGSTEEDTLDSCKGEETRGEIGVGGVNPLERPLGLLLHGGDGVNRVKDVCLLFRIVDIRIDEEAVRFAVNGFEQILAGVEEPRLRPLDFAAESCGKILHHNAVGPREESENVLNEVALVVIELLPVLHVAAEVNLLWSPEDGHVLLVFRPEVVVLKREDDEAVVIVCE